MKTDGSAVIQLWLDVMDGGNWTKLQLPLLLSHFQAQEVRRELCYTTLTLVELWP